MVKLTMENARPNTSEQKIHSAEQELNLNFPANYKRFLLNTNGGRPSPNVFPIKGNSTDKYGIVDWFYCVQAGDEYDITWAMALRFDRYPKNLLAIGTDPGGNEICLSVAGKDSGKVYFWDHENEVEEGEEPSYQNVYLIANSFEEFLESLKDESVLLDNQIPEKV